MLPDWLLRNQFVGMGTRKMCELAVVARALWVSQRCHCRDAQAGLV